MAFISTGFPGLIVAEPTIIEDNRGYFFEAYHDKLFAEGGITAHFVQDNQSRSGFGVIRGLHYQRPPHAQSKLIRVVSGAILDVAVDIRKGSPTYGKVFTIELSAANKKQLFLPAGFAHGFSVISEIAEVLYKCDAYYNRQSEGGIAFDDPQLAIEWMIPHDKRVISEKDKSLPRFSEYAGDFHFEP